MTPQETRRLLHFYHAQTSAPRKSIPSRRHMKNMSFTKQTKQQAELAKHFPVMRNKVKWIGWK